MNRTLVIIVAIALVVAGIATIFLTPSETTVPIPKPSNNSSSSNNNSDTNNRENLHNNNTGFRSSLKR